MGARSNPLLHSTRSTIRHNRMEDLESAVLSKNNVQETVIKQLASADNDTALHLL